MSSLQALPPYVREGVKEILLRQSAALDSAIERGNVGMQFAIARRMTALERALSGADHELHGMRETARR